MVIGVLYFVVGFGFAELAKPPVSDRVRLWRLAAWVISAVIYAMHIYYERLRQRASILATALHAAMAVALGAFLLAVAATIHKIIVASDTPYWRFMLALLVWPIITALPAFLVALAAAAVLSKLRTQNL